MFGPPLLPQPSIELVTRGGRGDPVSMLGAARTVRNQIARKYDEATAYCIPGKVGIQSVADSLPVYDDTAGEAHAEFASEIQQGLIPNFARWVSFIAGFSVPPDQKTAVNGKLQQVGQFVGDQINASNFPLEMGESLQDVGIGTGAIDISPSIGGKSAVNARAIPLGNLYFLLGPDGMPDPIYEVRRGYAHHAQVMFPGSSPVPQVLAPEKAAAEIEFIECWQRDWSEPEAYRYFQTVFVPDAGNVKILEKTFEGEGACAKIVFRWSKASGEVWGRGPGINLLPSIRKVNFAEQALLDRTEWELMGMWTVEDDGVINTETVRMEPGALLTVAMGSGGVKNVAPGGRMDVAAFQLEEARKSIRRGFFNDELGDPNRSPKTATEIDARVRKLAQKIGSPMGRLLVEGIIPCVVRVVRILKDRGLLKLPSIDGKQIQLMPSSPLAQAQRYEDIDILQGYAERVTTAFGREGVALLIAEDRWGEHMADRMHLPAHVLRTPDERAKMAQNAVEMGAEPGEPGPVDAGAGELPLPAPPGMG